MPLDGRITVRVTNKKGEETMRKAMLEARKRLGLSQDKVAREVGYKTSQGYANVEKGRKKPSADMLVKLEKLLGVPASALMENTPATQ
jgi:transcriptional regulator with XRE-family HTH domain